jgi:ATP-dependent Lon protease
MLKIIDVPLPTTMTPSLAERLAAVLTGAQASLALQHFVALALLHVSWKQLSDELSVKEVSVYLAQLVIDTPPSLLLTQLSNRELFRRDALFDIPEMIDVPGPVLRMQAELAATNWAALILNSSVTGHASDMSTIFTAAVQDDSFFSNQTAEYMLDEIALHLDLGNDEFEDGGGSPFTSLSGVSEFASPMAAIEYLKDQRQVAQSKTLLLATPGDAEPVLGPLAHFAISCFSPDDAASLLANVPTRAADSNERQSRLLHSMSNDTGLRHVTQVPNLGVLIPLYTQFPHFSEVLEFIAARLALASAGAVGAPLKLPPLLLRGAPGTGKSFFAEELTRALGGVFESRDLSVMTEAFVLTGLDSSWRGAKPGLIFESLVTGQVANPVINLDEIDKCTISGTHNSPLSALHSLLEPGSASRFKDEFIPLSLNASHVNWILTANDGYIPIPILSRVDEFDIRTPTSDECRTIAASVWSQVCRQVLPLGHAFPLTLPAEILDSLSSMSPRIMKKALTATAAKAASHGNNCLTVQYLEQAKNRYTRGNGRSIGF